MQAGGEVAGGLSDDDKIRLQICLDVEYLGEQVGVFPLMKMTLSFEFNYTV